jgi:gliding motility-associated-like protein
MLLSLIIIETVAAQPCKNIRNNAGSFTDKCVKIRSILVDACGNPEGENEIVLFETGKNPVSMISISVKWANTTNKWLGLTQSAATSALVSDINATITGCGNLLEPSGFTIPANKKVYLFTSTNFIVGSNQFTNLSDTAYAIFQRAGNTAGHFANYSTPSGLRTTILSVLGNCSDTATYDKVKMVKQNGNVGAEDGGYVSFDSAGNPSYLNDGCNAPVDPLRVTAVSLNGIDFCPGDSVKLKGTVSAGLCFVWRSATGRFSDTTSLLPIYYPDFSNPSFPELWLFNCNSSVKATVSYNIKSKQPVLAGKDTLLCAGTPVSLKMVSGSGPVSWRVTGGKGMIQNAASSATNYIPSASDTVAFFILRAYNGCSISEDTFKAVWIQKIKSDFQLSDTAICQHTDSVFLVPLNKGGFFNGLTLSATPAHWPAIPGRYRIVYITSNKGCIDSTVKYLVVHPIPDPRFDFIPNDTINVGEIITAMPLQTGVYRHLWSENGNPVTWPFPTFKEGSFRILHTITDSITGCSDTFSSTYIVLAPEDFSMTNIFTPNGDGKNDIFNFRGTGITTSQLRVFNRWGELLFESNDSKIGWNGKTMQGVNCPEGTYFWQMSYMLRNGKAGKHSGSVNLIR